MGKDFYSVLDIDLETDKEEIRQAYVNLARKYHPDISNFPDAKERFEEINLAYEILSDDEKRIFYNLYYRGDEDAFDDPESLPWWKRYEQALSIGILALGVLMGLMAWLVARSVLI